MPDGSTTPDLEQIAQTSLQAASRRDYDRAVALYSPDGVFDLSRLGMGLFEGHDAIRGFYEDWSGVYEEYEVALGEFSNLGTGVALFVAFQQGRPVGGTGVVQLRQGFVVLADGALIERVTVYADVGQARAAAERLAEERE